MERSWPMGLRRLIEQGILHRDLKPSNLRVNKEGRLKIPGFWSSPMVRTRRRFRPHM